MKSIDVHTHALPKSYLDALADHGISTVKEDGFPEPAWDEASHLEFMDFTGQAFEILTVSSPHPQRGDNAKGMYWAKKINDEFADICHRHPDKFGFATYLPLPDVEGSIEEAIRGYDELGAIGVKVPSNAMGVYMGDPRLEPLMEVLNERNAVVTIHPCAPQDYPAGIFTAQTKPLFEFFTDTTRTLINMITTGTISKYPNIKWVIPHCGSFLPEVYHRLIATSKILIPQGMMPEIDLQADVASLYFDTAGAAQPVMLDALLKIAKPDHIMYGADAPYTPKEMVLNFKNGLEADPLLADCKEDVFYNNAAKLYGLNL